MGFPRQVRLSLLVAALMAVMGWLVVRPEQMYVERIEFVGNQRATAAELRHLADVRNGVRLWEVDLRSLTAGVSRHPWVSSVEAERRFPGTVVVRVTEHEPVAMLAVGADLFYVDAAGTPFLHAQADDLDHPVIVGLDPDFISRDARLPGLILHDALWLLDQLDARDLIPRARVSELRFQPTRGFTLQTAGALPGHATAEVLFGLGDYTRQLDHLGGLLDRDIDLSQPLHIDLAPEKVAIVRPRGPLRPGALAGVTASASLPSEAALDLPPTAIQD